MPTDNYLLYAFIIFFIINILALLIMFVDKIKSTDQNNRRISEGMLFFMAAAFGSIGVYAGMFLFRHKTKKWYFLLGMPLLIAQNIIFVYCAYLFFAGRLVSIFI